MLNQYQYKTYITKDTKKERWTFQIISSIVAFNINKRVLSSLYKIISYVFISSIAPLAPPHRNHPKPYDN